MLSLMERALREREGMSEIQKKGSGDVEEGGVLWLQGIMGAGLASSLAGNRILNGCLLAPSHRHTHTRMLPPCVFSPCPHSDSSHIQYYSELHQSSFGVNVSVCVCAPRGHTMDPLNDFGGLELQTSFLIYFLGPLALVPW